MRGLRLFFAVVVFLPVGVKAQDTVLVVPFGRFDFYSAFKLEEIGAYNKIKSQEVYLAYSKAMRQTMENYEDSVIRYVFPDSTDLMKIRLLVTYEMRKKPKSYYGVNVMDVTPQDFRMLLDKYGAKYILFVNWYHIKKTKYRGLSGNARKFPYSYHYIDFDVLDRKRNWVGAEGQFTLDFPTPNKTNLKYKNLRLVEVKAGYERLAGRLGDWLISKQKKG